MSPILLFLFILACLGSLWYLYMWTAFLIINIKMKHWVVVPVWWADVIGIVSIVFVIAILLTL